MRGLVSAFLVVALVGGCSLGGVLPSPSIGDLIKPTHGPVDLTTAGSPIPSAPCPLVVEGWLVESAITGLGLLARSGAMPMEVIWPQGYRAGPSVAGANLFDASGELLASTGDRVRIEAVQQVHGGPLVICGRVARMSLP